MESVREILDEDLADSEIAFPPEEVEASQLIQQGVTVCRYF